MGKDKGGKCIALALGFGRISRSSCHLEPSCSRPRPEPHNQSSVNSTSRRGRGPGREENCLLHVEDGVYAFAPVLVRGHVNAAEEAAVG